MPSEKRNPGDIDMASKNKKAKTTDNTNKNIHVEIGAQKGPTSARKMGPPGIGK
jgi:hypothetical protein